MRTGNDICPKCLAAHPATMDCTLPPLASKSVVTQASRQDRQDALAKALCLLDSFAGEGLGHVYGNGTSLDADDVCVELASAFGVEFEPGWYRKVAAHSPSEPSVVSQDLVPVAWMYEWTGPEPKDVTQFRAERPDKPLLPGWNETPLYPASAIEAAQIAARNDALEAAAQIIDRLTVSGEPFTLGRLAGSIRALRTPSQHQEEQ